MKQIGSLLIIFLLFLTLSCSQRPRNVLSKKEMIEVLYDLQLAQSMSDDYNIELSKTPEGKEAIMKSVLTKHKLSQADLDSSVVWYSDNLTEYKIINDSVIARLRNRLRVLRKEEDILRGINVIKDKHLSPYFYLDRADYKRTFLFKESDLKNDEKLANFRLKFKVLGLNGEDRKIENGIYFVYKDTTIVSKNVLLKDSLYIIEKPNLPDSLLTQIQGYFRIPQARTFMPIKIYDVEYINKSVEEEKDEVGEKDENRKDTIPSRLLKEKELKVDSVK